MVSKIELRTLGKSDTGKDVKPLHALAEEKKMKRYLCVSLEPRRRKMDAVTVLPWEDFLSELWSGHYS